MILYDDDEDFPNADNAILDIDEALSTKGYKLPYDLEVSSECALPVC